MPHVFTSIHCRFVVSGKQLIKTMHEVHSLMAFHFYHFFALTYVFINLLSYYKPDTLHNSIVLKKINPLFTHEVFLFRKFSLYLMHVRIPSTFLFFTISFSTPFPLADAFWSNSAVHHIWNHCGKRRYCS